MLKKKKAQSEIITTVLIILLVLAAVVIVWQVVSRTMNTAGSEISDQEKCRGIILSVQKAQTTSNATKTGNITIVREIDNKADIKVKGLIYLSTDQGTTWTLSSRSTGLLDGITTPSERVDYSTVNDLPEGTRVKVTPQLESGYTCGAQSSEKSVVVV